MVEMTQHQRIADFSIKEKLDYFCMTKDVKQASVSRSKETYFKAI
jgi:hypothetical protein